MVSVACAGGFGAAAGGCAAGLEDRIRRPVTALAERGVGHDRQNDNLELPPEEPIHLDLGHCFCLLRAKHLSPLNSKQAAGRVRADLVAEDLPVLLRMVGATARPAHAGAPKPNWSRYLGLLLDGLAVPSTETR